MLTNPCLCALGNALRVLHFINKDNKIFYTYSGHTFV